MTLRVRKAESQGTSTSTGSSPDGKKAYNESRHAGQAATAPEAAAEAAASSSSPESTPETTPAAAIAKKLPRVILKVGPRPET